MLHQAQALKGQFCSISFLLYISTVTVFQANGIILSSRSNKLLAFRLDQDNNTSFVLNSNLKIRIIISETSYQYLKTREYQL